MLRNQPSSDFLHYLASNATREPDQQASHLPSLAQLSKEMRISVALLREQLEVAKALGLVEVRPHTGIRSLPYSFLPAVRQSLSYAIELDSAYFEAFSDLRNHLESAYWDEAVRCLTGEDIQTLQDLMARAWEKLRGSPIQIPHAEHRQLHLHIFSKLKNPFVQSLLEAYWEVYEAVGLDVYTDFNYLEQVWHFHQQMVDNIARGDFDAGFRALVEHKDLLYHRPTH